MYGVHGGVFLLCAFGVSFELGLWLFVSLCSVCCVSGDVIEIEAERCYCG